MTTDFDKHVGARLKQRRWMLKLTQNELAQRTGLTFQQIHKYESGRSRVYASRLYELAEALGVGLDYFFHDFDQDAPSQGASAGLLDTFNVDREAALLVRAYYKVPERQRRSLLELMRAMSDKGRAAEALDRMAGEPRYDRSEPTAEKSNVIAYRPPVDPGARSHLTARRRIRMRPKRRMRSRRRRRIPPAPASCAVTAWPTGGVLPDFSFAPAPISRFG